MKLQRTDKIETNLYELEIRVEGEEWKAGIDRSFRKNSGKLSIPGFRKGKAPRGLFLRGRREHDLFRRLRGGFG